MIGVWVRPSAIHWVSRSLLASPRGCRVQRSNWATMMISAGREPHWRDGEKLIEWVEEVCRAPMVWQSLRALKPSSRYVEAWDAQVYLITHDRQLQKREPLWLRAHQEESGVRIIKLTSNGGNQTLRRGHIGGSHQCPDGGPFLAGPHIHYPTTIYQEIGGRGRSRACPWSVDEGVSLREAIRYFVNKMGIGGLPDEQALLLEGS